MTLTARHLARTQYGVLVEFLLSQLCYLDDIAVSTAAHCHDAAAFLLTAVTRTFESHKVKVSCLQADLESRKASVSSYVLEAHAEHVHSSSIT